MEIKNADKAQVLVEALPYLQKYYNKVVVVKYGGNAMVNPQLKEAVMSDIVLLSLVGIKVVLVHGGGPEITQTLSSMGKESKFVGGLRCTDEETIKVVQMVLCGKTNKDLVRLLQQNNGRAIGMCGVDGRMIQAKKLESDPDLGYVGEITKIDPAPILDVLEKGYIPVIATIGCDEEGNVYNINADLAAARIAAQLKAENLISMTDVAGLLRDKEDPSSLISVVKVSEVPALIQQEIVSGGMIPKVNCCVEAVRRGVKRAFIIDGRVAHSILIEMMTDEGMGTMFLG
ncbi:acetylglutamate kinase [Youxingia wuxianensis]|uniref:Acetylglutamate kinase n=1 Tax=Youxingia wuxianensis TaxID=2763678 RepID=A0A926EPS7_9FIRM|nr:acetylglutamate kinase [Youxingia wuxianensis]MBC8585908.1 acetylglutamate kinase [Youxingia wuxianensis]